MLLVYENRIDGIVAEWKKTVHFPPHLHEAIEVVYVTDGDIELGVGQELYHMDEGDFAIVFPNVIHHYQVFGKKENKVIYLYLDPTLFPSYYKELQIYSPKNPVVKKEQVPRGHRQSAVQFGRAFRIRTGGGGYRHFRQRVFRRYACYRKRK